MIWSHVHVKNSKLPMNLKTKKNQNRLFQLKLSSSYYESILSEDLRMFLSLRNYGLLSFGNEAEEDEEELTKVSTV